MRRRCYNCKCIGEESTTQFYKRTKIDPSAKFLCKKCQKDPLWKEKKNIENSQAPKNEEKIKQLLRKKNNEGLTDEEKQMLGQIYRTFSLSYLKKLDTLKTMREGTEGQISYSFSSGKYSSG